MSSKTNFEWQLLHNRIRLDTAHPRRWTGLCDYIVHSDRSYRAYLVIQQICPTNTSWSTFIRFTTSRWQPLVPGELIAVCPRPSDGREMTKCLPKPRLLKQLYNDIMCCGAIEGTTSWSQLCWTMDMNIAVNHFFNNFFNYDQELQLQRLQSSISAISYERQLLQ